MKFEEEEGGVDENGRGRNGNGDKQGVLDDIETLDDGIHLISQKYAVGGQS